MKTTTLMLAACSTVMLLLPACGTSSAAYVDRSLGYAVTKGEVAQVKNLSSESSETLSDGVAIVVSGDNCEVTMKFGDNYQPIRVGPQSIVVYGEQMDYILEPYPGAHEQTEAPPEIPSPDPAALSTRNVKK